MREVIMFSLTSSGIRPTVLKIAFIFISFLTVLCSSFPSNTSRELSRGSYDSTNGPLNTTNDSQVSENRQGAGAFAVSGPVAASLAFVGLNLAFISLLVPFVMTAITVGERNYPEDDGKDFLENQWSKLRSLPRWNTEDNRYNMPGRVSLNTNRNMTETFSRYSPKFLNKTTMSDRKT